MCYTLGGKLRCELERLDTGAPTNAPGGDNEKCWCKSDLKMNAWVSLRKKLRHDKPGWLSAFPSPPQSCLGQALIAYAIRGFGCGPLSRVCFWVSGCELKKSSVAISSGPVASVYDAVFVEILFAILTLEWYLFHG